MGDGDERVFPDAPCVRPEGKPHPDPEAGHDGDVEVAGSVGHRDTLAAPGHGTLRRCRRPRAGPSSPSSCCPGRLVSSYEIVWSRQLVLVFGNTTQAVSAILAGFFGGMAIGSVVGGRLADRVRSPLRMYGLIELVLVVVVLVTPLTFRLIRSLYGEVCRRSRGRAAAPRRAPIGPCAAGPGAGDRADGRHAADADAPSQRRRAPERVVRAAVRGEHDRGHRRHVRWPGSS